MIVSHSPVPNSIDADALLQVYDLPSELKPNGRAMSANPPPNNHPQQPYSTTPLQSPGTTPFTAINGSFQPQPPQPTPQPQQPQPQPDEQIDWSFLKEFGDPTDEFFTFDGELRSLLEGGFASGNSRFI